MANSSQQNCNLIRYRYSTYFYLRNISCSFESIQFASNKAQRNLLITQIKPGTSYQVHVKGIWERDFFFSFSLWLQVPRYLFSVFVKKESWSVRPQTRTAPIVKFGSQVLNRRCHWAWVDLQALTESMLCSYVRDVTSSKFESEEPTPAWQVLACYFVICNENSLHMEK